MDSSPIIVWLRQDLRLADNPALYYALQQSQTIIPIYILDTTLPKEQQLGGASKWWLHHSLNALQQNFAKHNVTLILRKGDPAKILPELIKITKAKAIFWNYCYEPSVMKRDEQLKKDLQQNEVMVNTYNASLLFKPQEIKNQQGSYFKVFTRFWQACLAKPAPTATLPAPKLISTVTATIKSDQLESWHLLPTKPDWSTGISEHWQPGETNAIKQLKHFLNKKITNYSRKRDFPAIDNTSQLSPYLHFGEISPRQIWHACHKKVENIDNNLKNNIETFLKEIGWREFSYHLLYHFPDLSCYPFRREFAKFPWRSNKAHLKAWQQGNTGFPIIDAGMRQLWHIGWMHNRVRMIVASFLTKDLLIPWQTGAAWFWDTLVDADLANNSASWQWVAGSGADAAPYFRIFNPVLQGEKFDPDGEYVKQWVPELKTLPKKYIHRPWEAPEAVLLQAKIKLGKDYPKPIVNHTETRKEALNAFKTLRV